MIEYNESDYEELIKNIFNQDDFNDYICDNLTNNNKNKLTEIQHQKKINYENNKLFKQDNILFNPDYENKQGLLFDHELFGVIGINPKYFNIYPSYNCSIENRKTIKKRSCFSFGNIRVESKKNDKKKFN